MCTNPRRPVRICGLSPFSLRREPRSVTSRGSVKRAQISTTARRLCEQASVQVSAKKSLYLPSDAAPILSTLLFFLSLILNPFYYYFFPCTHQGGCLVLILLAAITHKGGVHFIWVAFYIQTMIKMHGSDLA